MASHPGKSSHKQPDSLFQSHQFIVRRGLFYTPFLSFLGDVKSNFIDDNDRHWMPLTDHGFHFYRRRPRDLLEEFENA